MIAHSESIAKLAAAYCKAHAALSNPLKDATAQISAGRAYHYAQLSSVIDHCRPTLAKCGLAITQHLNGEPGILRVTTILLHDSGEYLSSDATIALPPNCTPQQLGSATTYLRRYGYQAVLGLAAEDDDDGAAASVPTTTKPAAQAKSAPTAPPADVPTKTVTTTITDVAVKEGEREGRKWKLYRITVDTGKTCSTFDTKIGDLALTLNGTGEPVKLTVKPGKDGKGFDVVALVPEMPSEPVPADDDIPF